MVHAPVPDPDPDPVPDPVPPPDTLAAERRLLDAAQSAIVDGDGAVAMRSVRRHASSFAHGKLVEEREALRVQALVLTGDADRARRRGTAFLSDYPRSIQRGAVLAALEALPE